MSDDSEYEFTTDWFHWAIPLLKSLRLGMTKCDRILEIGAFEGRSTVWMAEHMLEGGGELTSIDTWRGGEEHGGVDMEVVYGRWKRNVEKVVDKFPDRYVEHLRSPSLGALTTLSSLNELYDLIYIDGSHQAKDVLTDAVMAWPLLEKDGFMVFDDYMWGDKRDILHRPKIAIDAFVNIFAEELEVVHCGYQLAVAKRT